MVQSGKDLLNKKNIHNDVSVIIPCYGQGEFVEEAVDSVLANIIRPIAILVFLMDEESWALRTKLEKNDSVRCIIGSQQSLPQARNTLAQQVTTRWFIPLDADDKLPPNFIQQMTRHISSHDIVYCKSHTFGDYEEVWDNPPKVELSWLKEDNNIPSCALIKTSVWKAVGGYDESFTFGYEDWEFYLRLAVQEKSFKKCTTTHLQYRKHGETLLTEAVNRREEVVNMIHGKFPQLYETIPDPPKTNAPKKVSRIPQKKVSVIIPCYKQSRFLIQTVESVLKQSHLPIEIIILLMDKDSWSMKEHLDKMSPLIHSVISSQKLLPSARNFAIGLSKGTHFIPLDADDTLPPNYIAEMVAHDADVVYGNARYMSDTREFISPNDIWPADPQEKVDWDLMSTFRKNSIVGTALVNKAAWADTGGYNDNLTSFEDYEFWIHLYFRGYTFKKAVNAILNYRIHDTSLLSSTLKQEGKKEKLHSQIMDIQDHRYQRIPKIIHYVWVGDPKKKPVENIEQWKTVMPEPEWTYMEWNESNIDIDSVLFLRQAYDAKKYGITVDPLRAQILYKYGGIYLDTDVTVNRSLRPFLQYNFFGGYESHFWVMAGTVGASKGLPMMKWLQEFYDGVSLPDFTVRKFLEEVRTGPVNITRALQAMLPEWGPDGRPYTGADSQGNLYRIEPAPVFTLQDPFKWTDVGRNYTTQLYEGSWTETDQDFGAEIMRVYAEWKSAQNIDWEQTRDWLRYTEGPYEAGNSE